MQSEAGTETTGLAQMMGHSTTQTLQRYVHSTFEHHQKAVTGLEKRVMEIISGDGAGRKSDGDLMRNLMRERAINSVAGVPLL